MYLKKVEGPRTVKLPSGRVICQTDLPNGAKQRWVASMKELVVLAIQHGLLTRKEAKDRYCLSDEELTNWETTLVLRGKNGLKVTRLQDAKQL